LLALPAMDRNKTLMPSFILRDIPDDFWRNFKIRATQEDLTLKKAVYEALKTWLDRPATGRTGEV